MKNEMKQGHSYNLRKGLTERLLKQVLENQQYP